jgi:hypothetical protein
MRRWLEREQCIFVVFRIGRLLTLLLLTCSRCIIVLGSGSGSLLTLPPFNCGGPGGCAIVDCVLPRSSRVIQLASSSLVERVQLITDDPTAWSMTPAMAPRAHAKVSHDHAPPTFFTPWTTAMSPFSRLTRMTPLGSLQLSMNFGYPQGQPSHFRREGNISATIGLHKANGCFLESSRQAGFESV